MTEQNPNVIEQLRPETLDNYVGQERLKEQIKVSILAALRADPKRPMEHLLLQGPPGAGKTTLARIVAAQLYEHYMEVEMPFTDTDLRELRSFAGVLFLDEIHRGTKAQQEELLPALDERRYIRPKGRYSIQLPWLTVIGATTEPMKVIRPLRDRFPLQPHFDQYTDEEMTRIISGMAGRIGLELAPEDCEILGRATVGVPRVAGNLVRTAQNLTIGIGSRPSAADVLYVARLDEYGLGPDHCAYLELLWNVNGPIGLTPLKNILDKDEASIRDLERTLIRQGLVIPTMRGRELTAEGFARVKQQKGTV